MSEPTTQSELSKAILAIPCRTPDDPSLSQAVRSVDWKNGFIRGFNAALTSAAALAGEREAELKGVIAGLRAPCPQCDGTGEGFVPVLAKTVDGKPLSEADATALADELGKCFMCKAVGTVTREQAAWFARGQEWRLIRLAAGKGLREWAESVGVLPSDYSKMESGEIEPREECSPVAALTARLSAAEAERDEARTRLLSAAGDDLCRLTQEEIKAMSAGEVQIPPKEEFLPSCERFWEQMAGTAGVMTNCLTLAQLIAENERLRQERNARQQTVEILRTENVNLRNGHPPFADSVHESEPSALRTRAESAEGLLRECHFWASGIPSDIADRIAAHLAAAEVKS